MFKPRKAQNILEYVIVFAALVLAIYVFAFKILKIRRAVETVTERAAEEIVKEADQFDPDKLD